MSMVYGDADESSLMAPLLKGFPVLLDGVGIVLDNANGADRLFGSVFFHWRSVPSVPETLRVLCQRQPATDQADRQHHADDAAACFHPVSFHAKRSFPILFPQ
jgi:hypothetical protein